MADITKIKPGQVLYDKHKHKMGNTKMTTWGVWPVSVKEVDPDGKFIVASWNGNPPRRMYESTVKKLKVKEPKISE
jgi:hypothetical protein